MRATLCLALCVTVTAGAIGNDTGVRFYDDDPLEREPETRNAAGAREREIDLFYDLLANTFTRPGDPVADVRARSVTSIDEVADSSWFTNRDLRELPLDALARGPVTTGGPAPGAWSIIASKSVGAAPGFTMRDRAGDVWFIEFDAPGFAEGATGALIVANRIFWALGYWQVEQHLASFREEMIEIAETAHIRRTSGALTPMTRDDLSAMLRRVQRSPDGSYRVVAARAVPGTPLGSFAYHGTRSDDPNDLVPHEHRRELRALKVFAAWTNLVDLKAGNTLDALITEGGRSYIRHYLQDVGSAFGIGANGPHAWDEGFESLYDGGKLARRLVSMGFYLQPWQTARYERLDAIGRFEGDAFDPLTWQPRVPNAAILRARADDDFWAARRVMAFSDEMIRAIVRTGGYGDVKAEAHLGDVLIARRDKIGRAYLPAVNPIVTPALDAAGTLTFVNAAVSAGVAAAPLAGYRARWFRFDNQTRATVPIGDETTALGNTLRAPGGLAEAGAFIKIELSAVRAPHESWARPIDLYFRRSGNGWRLVGLDRLP